MSMKSQQFRARLMEMERVLTLIEGCKSLDELGHISEAAEDGRGSELRAADRDWLMAVVIERARDLEREAGL